MDWDENVFLVKADIVVQIYGNIKALKKAYALRGILH